MKPAVTRKTEPESKLRGEANRTAELRTPVVAPFVATDEMNPPYTTLFAFDVNSARLAELSMTPAEALPDVNAGRVVSA